MVPKGGQTSVRLRRVAAPDLCVQLDLFHILKMISRMNELTCCEDP